MFKYYIARAKVFRQPRSQGLLRFQDGGQSSRLKLSSKSMVILPEAQFFDLKSFESEIEIENLKLKLKFFETVLFPVYTTSTIAWKQV